MFKRLRKAASNFFKKITSVFKPKVKKPRGNKIPIGGGDNFKIAKPEVATPEVELPDLPQWDKKFKPGTLPGNGANYDSPFPLPDDTIRDAVESGNWHYTESKPAFISKLELWYATMTDAIGIIAAYKMSQNSYDTWFSESIKITDSGMMEVVDTINRTDALDYLDWYENNGGKAISDAIDYALAASDTAIAYQYNEQISDLLLDLING